MRPPLRSLLTLALPVAVAAAIVGAGCSVGWLQDLAGSEPRVAFPHRPHLAEDLECTTCHRLNKETGEYGRTSPKTCEKCHEDEAQKFAPFYEDKKPRGPFHVTLSPEIVFDHRTHLGHDVKCEDCHRDLKTSDSLGSELAPSMQGCIDCHAARGAKTDCETCHREIRADRKPPSHDEHFLRTHGTDLAGHDRAQQPCFVCHTQASCNGCHLQSMPASHNNQFRRRGHGLFASTDRESCQTCHQTDFCVRCHSNTMPSSHTGSFGSPRDRHCLVCHQPVGSEPSCAVCHASTPSHSQARPKPPGHTPGMNCRQCHGLTAPLPHVDNGDNCNDCHH